MDVSAQRWVVKEVYPGRPWVWPYIWVGQTHNGGYFEVSMGLWRVVAHRAMINTHWHIYHD